MANRNRRRARLKKETIRKLDVPALPPEDLAQAAGGAIIQVPLACGEQPYTTQCITMC